VFNAANEAAVALFLSGRIRFAEIGPAIRDTLDSLSHLGGDNRDAILAADAAARAHVKERFGC